MKNARRSKSQPLLEKIASVKSLSAALAHLRLTLPDDRESELNELEEGLTQTCSLILSGCYRPGPVERRTVPKPGGKGVRILGSPQLRDRLVQRSIVDTLTPIYEKTFHESSHGSRIGSGQQSAIDDVREILNYRTWQHYASLDIYDCFGQLPHSLIRRGLEKQVPEDLLLNLVQSFLCSTIDRGSTAGRGVHQGSPMSSFMASVVLLELDRQIDRLGHPFVRYADNIWVFARDAKTARLLSGELSLYIESRLRMRFNSDKTLYGPVTEIPMLGFILRSRSERPAEITLDPSSVDRFQRKLRCIAEVGGSEEQIEHSIDNFLNGWGSYYGACTSDPDRLFDLLNLTIRETWAGLELNPRRLRLFSRRYGRYTLTPQQHPSNKEVV